MFYCQFQTAHPWECIGQFLLNIGFIIRELPAQVRADFTFLIFILYDAYPAEDDHAVYIQRPFALLPEAFIHHTVTDFVTGSDCIGLMAGLRAMEIELMVFFRVPVIQRNSIRISAVTDHGEDASFLLLQDPYTGLFADLLLETPHFPESQQCSRFVP